MTDEEWRQHRREYRRVAIAYYLAWLGLAGAVTGLVVVVLS